METSAKGLYAIGDVAGPPMLAHKGEREGMIVAEVIAGKHFHPLSYGNVPNATYCHPEVASIGLTEAQVKEKKIDYKVGKFPYSANGRARTSGETEGFVKIIRDAKYGEILGAHIVGAHATELIHELAVARENEFTVEEIELAIHAHPTLCGIDCRGCARFAGARDSHLICAEWIGYRRLEINCSNTDFAETRGYCNCCDLGEQQLQHRADVAVPPKFCCCGGGIRGFPRNPCYAVDLITAVSDPIRDDRAIAGGRNYVVLSLG